MRKLSKLFKESPLTYSMILFLNGGVAFLIMSNKATTIFGFMIRICGFIVIISASVLFIEIIRRKKGK